MAEVLTDSRQMLLRALAAKDTEIERLRNENDQLRAALKQLLAGVRTYVTRSS